MKTHDVAAAHGPPFLEAMMPLVMKSFAHVCMKWYVAWARLTPLPFSYGSILVQENFSDMAVRFIFVSGFFA